MAPIYRSFVGVLARDSARSFGPNPVHERQEIKGAVWKLRSAALSASPREREETVAYTLAAEEAQKAAKIAAERALDRRRHDVVMNIYELVPQHRTLLTAARRGKRAEVIPPAAQQVAALAAARASAEAGWLSPDDLRPITAPTSPLAEPPSRGPSPPPPRGRRSPPLGDVPGRPSSRVASRPPTRAAAGAAVRARARSGAPR